MQLEYIEYSTSFGELLIGTHNQQLVLCDWKYRKMRTTLNQKLCKALDTEMVEKNNAIIEETTSQLSQYFNKERKVFDLPLQLVGTEFQKKVWKVLLEIPYGKTISYLELSQQLNNVKAIRAVASANGANTISVIIPCHRVIGSNGELTGYAGGLSAKKKLLQLENAYKQLELF